jgi:energy-coupling factor transporter ATP-binding protein EcfA2
MTTDDKKIIYSMLGVSKIVPPNKEIIKDISLSYFYGAKIGVLGLNGSGKSTLLKIMAGIDQQPTTSVSGIAAGFALASARTSTSSTMRRCPCCDRKWCGTCPLAVNDCCSKRRVFAPRWSPGNALSMTTG